MKSNYKNYLIENDNRIEDIEKYCGPYLKELRYGRNCFIRYSSTYKTNIEILKKTGRKDRLPVDTPLEISSFMDDTFKKKFGWKARSEGLFVWVMEKITNFYIARDLSGRIGMFIFPIGKYKYIYSPEIIDVYTEIQNMEDDYDDVYYSKNEKDRMIFNEFKRWWLESLAGLKTYKNKNVLKSPVSSLRFECMLSTKEYYIVSPSIIKEISDALDLGMRINIT